MSKKGKSKGTKMNLAEFTGANDGNDLAWAEDDQWGEPHQDADDGTGKKPKFFGFKAGEMGDFRQAPVEQLSTLVPEDMEPPFVAHIGNLPNSMTEEQLAEAFSDIFTVNSTYVVHRNKTTFGYVEFAERDELQRAILQTGRNLGGRRIRVDVATQQQRDRIKNGGADAGPALSRDAMNQEQPEFPGMRRGMRPSNSFDGFTRDNFGSTDNLPDRLPAAGSLDELGDFRSNGPVSQPQPPAVGKGNWRSSKPASPNIGTAPDLSKWRDEPRESQPTAQAKEEGGNTWRKGSAVKEAPALPTANAEAQSNAWRKTSPTAQKTQNWRDAPTTETPSWRDQAAKPPEPKESQKPQVRAQPKKSSPQPQAKAIPISDNRFSALRK